MPRQRAENHQSRCPLDYGYHAFGGKWKPRILCVLGEASPRRYTDIRRHIANITDAVLSHTLKELIAQGMVKREQFDEIPPRVEYSLTEKSRSALPLLREICAWSSRHMPLQKTSEPPECCCNCSHLDAPPSEKLIDSLSPVEGASKSSGTPAARAIHEAVANSCMTSASS